VFCNFLALLLKQELESRINIRLDEERTCVLVLIGAAEDGTKELVVVAVVDGYSESTQSWRELLQQLKRLGLSTAPKLAIGDCSLGLWIALQEEYGPVAQQRCWVHKIANILDKMPKSDQGKAKQLIHKMYLAPTRKALTISSSPVIKPNFRRLANVSRKMKKSFLPFMIFQPNIGRIYGPPIP
jgi:transposase-like protein